MKEAVVRAVELRLFDIAREIAQERKRIAEKLPEAGPSQRSVWEEHSGLVGEFYVLKAALDEDPNYAVDSFDDLESLVEDQFSL